MPAIQAVMKRLGFVKLSSYGLVLTPEGRIISLRPAVLDDGLGGRIVGWKDGDLAAMELERWEPARPAAKPAVASAVAGPVAAPLPPRVPQITRPMPVVAAPPPAYVVPKAAAAVVAAPVAMAFVPAAQIAEPAEPEDDWEWTIAIARARAAAEESDLAAVAAAAPVATPAPRRMRADTVPPPATTPVAKPSPRSMARVDADGWPKTEPLGDLDYNDYTNPSLEITRTAIVAVAKGTPAMPSPVIRAPEATVVTSPPPVAARTAPTLRPPTSPIGVPRVIAPRPATSPSTVIPIPKLPTMASTPKMTHIAPVVRSALPTPMMPAAPRRMAKGTGPVIPRPIDAAPVPGEDTVPNLPLPSVIARPIPSIRRAASQS